MSLPLVLSCLWVIASAIVALLPMRRQYLPGLMLLTLAPGLLGWIALVHGPWLVLPLFLAVLSMYRHPLRHLARRALGRAA